MCWTLSGPCLGVLWRTPSILLLCFSINWPTQISGLQIQAVCLPSSCWYFLTSLCILHLHSHRSRGLSRRHPATCDWIPWVWVIRWLSSLYSTYLEDHLPQTWCSADMNSWASASVETKKCDNPLCLDTDSLFRGYSNNRSIILARDRRQSLEI